MQKIKVERKQLVKISIYACITAFLIPWFFCTKDNVVTILSTAFTALGATATVFTLGIAISLYQKFGIESRFIAHQTDKVFELVDILKGKILYVKTNKFKYFLRFTIDNMERLEKEDFFNYMKGKTLIIKSSGYESFSKKILSLKNSYWMPSEIEEKLQFLIFMGYERDVDDPENEEYARINFGSPEDEKYVIPFPKTTVEEFIKNKNNLTTAVEQWLGKHSEIKIDLKLDISEFG